MFDDVTARFRPLARALTAAGIPADRIHIDQTGGNVMCLRINLNPDPDLSYGFYILYPDPAMVEMAAQGMCTFFFPDPDDGEDWLDHDGPKGKITWESIAQDAVELIERLRADHEIWDNS